MNETRGRTSTARICALVALTGMLAAPAWTGPVEAAEIRFEEVSESWGIHFRHHHGGSGELYMVETMGSGLAVFDYDGDGDQDVFFVDSGELPGYTGEEPRSRLFRNDGGRFVDVSERSGLRVEVYGQGATAGDVDGDGDLDLYVTGFGPNQLFLNRGDGTFAEAADSGAEDPGVGASGGFADVDRDGDLDLYVTNYVDFDLDRNVICGNEERGIRTYCHPDAYGGVPDRFFLNDGDGTFVDATEEAGFGMARGKGLGLVFSDIDGDHWPDLYVANDMTANYMFRNKGDGTFEELGLLSGTAYNDRGNPEAGMGVDVGDLNGDGKPEIMTTHMDDQTNAVYGYEGMWIFTDRRFLARLAEPSVGKVGFGLVFADFDQDADRDVAVANGHIIHNIDRFKESTSYKQRNQAFVNRGGGRFEEVEDAGFEPVRASRGLAFGDLDGDGDLDLVVNNSNDVAEVYENVTSGPGSWLQVDLEQRQGNLDAIGARVNVEAPGAGSQSREVRTASSYLSQNALALHFGLADAERLDRLTVTWPDGGEQIVTGLPANRRVKIIRN